MIKTMASISTDDCIPVLEADGVFIIENYVPDCSNIYSQAMQLCNEHGNPYEFGTAYRGGSINSHKPPIKSLFTAQWMKELHQKYNKTKGKFGSDVFATHDFKNNDGLARNGFLHFDRLWRLKYFLYLTDVGVNDGPFYCSPGSVNVGKKLRNSQQKNVYADKKNRILIDWPDFAQDFPPEPIIAKAGTLIVFDTDTFHMGGAVSGGSRLIIRLHCQ